MNCKPGDMAIFVKSFAGNEGKIVTCIRLATYEELIKVDFYRESPVWVIDQKVPTSRGSFRAFATDENLRPLRDPGNDAEDETFSWKCGKAPKIQEKETA